MSNPAVTKLRKLTIGSKQIWLDDNIGEAVHLHMDDIRIDFTLNEFRRFCNELCDVVNVLVEVDDFDCHDIDPQFFETMLWKKIEKLKKVDYKIVKLSDLRLLNEKGETVRLSDSKIVKALNGDESHDMPTSSDHIGQSRQARLKQVKELVKDEGYPFNNQYIITYGDDAYIKDGQHRAAVLYVEKGDISVQVQRFWFSDEDKPKDDSFRWTFIGQVLEAICHPILWGERKFYFLKEQKSRKEKEQKKAEYLSINKKDYLESLQILDSK